ncbi:hypothetical protein NGA_0381400 [Nannochloropsis gaditana CCMP526]|nr:hypothetical protein NGA_0381400 [Nannochloropsis gaditana CCMP526]EKU21406.1 hypothetical protein NGA_0381400 [Nannochloropsis gaditana CCMP526]|eukprot:XP_005854954.1 hypothetical protein NGA_0381400 [Nannochloropsis gaditana CCMP526]
MAGSGGEGGAKTPEGPDCSLARPR